MIGQIGGEAIRKYGVGHEYFSMSARLGGAVREEP